LLYVHGIGWHYWDGKRWAHDDTGAAKRAVFDVLGQALLRSLDPTGSYKHLRRDVNKCESAAGVAGVLDLAAALTPFAATAADLDADPYNGGDQMPAGNTEKNKAAAAEAPLIRTSQ
jgi:putative DNA primase/helicase